MRYQLALSFIPSSTFTVVARAVRSHEETMAAHFTDDETFLRLLGKAALAPDEHARLVFATMNAVS
jgi:hypothetical protein